MIFQPDNTSLNEKIYSHQWVLYPAPLRGEDSSAEGEFAHEPRKNVARREQFPPRGASALRWPLADGSFICKKLFANTKLAKNLIQKIVFKCFS